MGKCEVTRSVKQNFANLSEFVGWKNLVFMRITNKFVWCEATIWRHLIPTEIMRAYNEPNEYACIFNWRMSRQ